ncbi:MAG TPA: substrate-binding domain-containing protein [Spirochaetia bacterium]|nr:substrate-binding domain-containing protein [Spirochaetia bacterium]
MKSKVLVIAVVLFAVLAVTMAPAQNKGWASQVRIVFFPGGSPGGPFETVVYNGAKLAENDLGCKVNYVWSDWDTQKMLQQFREAVATRPDAICIMGHPGDEAFGPLIADAEKKGIIVTSGNTSLDKTEAMYAPMGFGYVGAELYKAGHDLGAESVKRFGLQKGNRVMVWGLLSQAGRGQRTKGIVDAFKEAGMTVDYLEIDNATNGDAPAGAPTFAGYVSSHPDVKAVVFDHGNLTSITENLMKAAGKKPGEIKAAGFDISHGSIAAIKSGYLGLVIDQQEWLQGYLPILQVCLSKVYGFSGLHINSGAGFLDKSNVDFVAPLAEKQVR